MLSARLIDTLARKCVSSEGWYMPPKTTTKALRCDTCDSYPIAVVPRCVHITYSVRRWRAILHPVMRCTQNPFAKRAHIEPAAPSHFVYTMCRTSQVI